jgi:hypothetical protein
MAACASPATLGSSPTPTNSPEQLYEFNGTVLENAEHGPQLCSVVLTSYPPQCGGVPVAGWNWTTVEGETKVGRIVWGEYRVVGSYDGKVFTITEAPSPPRRSNDPAKIGSACEKPAGGWLRPDPSRTNSEDFNAAAEYAVKQPDAAGLWIADAPAGPDNEQDFSHAVLNAGFTGSIERHETEIRKLWGGGLCLVKRDRTLVELERISNEAQSHAGSIGLTVTISDANEVTWSVDLGVFWADADAQKRMSDHFPGVTIKLIGEIKPVN